MSETQSTSIGSTDKQAEPISAPQVATTVQPAPTATAADAAPKPAPAPATVTPPIPSLPLVFTAKPMRIGVFGFLNIQPLIWGLGGHHKLVQSSPNQMGKLLSEGRVDVAIAPIAAYFLNPALHIVPIAAIGSNGAIKSIRILSHRPLQAVQCLYVDDRSQTSVLMARLILKKWFGVKDLEVVAIKAETFHSSQTKPWEAVLQFGDMALLSAPTGMTVTDLGEEWYLRTQKPFIHAVWMARSVPIAREIESDLLTAKNEGIKHCEEIVNQYKGLWTFHRSMAKEYLEKIVRYNYGPEEVKGQLEFQRLLKEEKLIL